MQAFQLYYTSCRHGLSPGAGFQIRAATPNLHPADGEQIIRLGLHKPPRTPEGSSKAAKKTVFETNPEASLLACPVAFRFFTLDSGRRVLQRSQYVGADYSSRTGNFFTHTLVLDAPPSLWPMEYYEWPSWRRSLAPGEDESPPIPLSPVSISAITPAESFSYEELSLFVHEHPCRPARLAAMLQSLFVPPEQRKPMLIRDEKENNPFWIACITRLLPRSVAWGLNISTYQHDPLPGMHITATVPGTAFDNPALTQQFHLFDMLDTEMPNSEMPNNEQGTYSAFNEPGTYSAFNKQGTYSAFNKQGTYSAFDEPGTYSAFLVQQLLDNPAQVQAFALYMEQFQCTQATPDLFHACKLFQGIPPMPQHKACTSADGISIILFATRHAKDQHMAAVLRDTWPFFVTLDPASYRKSYHTLLGYLLHFCPFETPNEQSSLHRILCDALNLCLQDVQSHTDSLLVPQADSLLSQKTVERLSSQLAPPCPPVDPQARQRLEHLITTAAEVLERLPHLAPSILAAVWQGLDQQVLQRALACLPVPTGLTVLRFLHVCLWQGALMPRKTLWMHSPLVALGLAFTSAHPLRLEALLRLIPAAERAGWILAHKADTAMPLPMGAALYALHRAVTPFEAATLRTNLDAAGAYRILLAEFRFMLDNAPDKEGCYDQYMTEIAPELTHFTPGRRAAWLHELLQNLASSPKRRNQAALTHLPSIPPQAYASRAPKWLQWANEACAFTLTPLPDHPNKARFVLMAALSSATATLELKLLPHYPALWRVCEIMRAGLPVDDNALVLCAAGFHFMDHLEYQAFLERVMPLLACQPRSRVAACLRLFHHHRYATLYADFLVRAMLASPQLPENLNPHKQIHVDPYTVPGAVFQLAVMEHETATQDFTSTVLHAAMQALQRLLAPHADLYDPTFHARCLEKLQANADATIKLLWAQLTAPHPESESFIRTMRRLWAGAKGE